MTGAETDRDEGVDWVTVLSVLSGLVYLGYSWWEQSGARVRPSVWISFHAGRIAEKVTEGAWDATLKLRRYYRLNTEV